MGFSEPVYTTTELVAAEGAALAVAAAMAEARPGSVRTLAYGPGERLAALESLGGAVAAWRQTGIEPVAVAPWRWAAAGIESCCGVDAVVLPGVGRAGGPTGATATAPALAAGGVLLVAEAQAYGPLVMDQLLEECRARGASAILLAPAGAVVARPLLSEMAAFGRQELALVPEPRFPAGAELECRHRFASVEVTVVASLEAARAEAVALGGAGRNRGAGGGAVGRSLVVAGDEAVVAAFRAGPALGCGTGQADAVHARDLAEALRSHSGPVGLVVLGGTTVLRQQAAVAKLERSHVLVVPGVRANSPEAIGRAAEAVRPRYLTSQLGLPAMAPAARRAWRGAAAAIEEHRQRWGIDHERLAFGPLQARALQAAGHPERAEEMLGLERQAAEVRSRGRGRPEPSLEASRWRGIGR